MTGGCWSVVLAGVGLAGLYLAGRRSHWGWALGLVDEMLWIVYGASTGQWAFCLSALAYGWVYAGNLRVARQARSDTRQPAKPADQGVFHSSGGAAGAGGETTPRRPVPGPPRGICYAAVASAGGRCDVIPPCGCQRGCSWVGSCPGWSAA
jgi:hypothetical protein